MPANGNQRMRSTQRLPHPRPRSFRDLLLAQRQFLIFLVYLVLTLPWLVQGSVKSLEPHANSPIDWVTSAFSPRAKYDAFRESFGQGDQLIVSWPACRVDNTRLDRLVNALRSSPRFVDSQQRKYFQAVTSGREVLRQLVAPPLAIPEEQARRRLLGTLIGPDLHTTAIVLTFTAEGVLQRRQVVQDVKAAIEYYCQVPENDQHMAGPIIDGLAVDLASQETLQNLAIPSALVTFGLCYLMLRSFRAAALVFAIAIYAQLVTLALVYYGGREVSALMIVLPPLIQVMAIAGGIHLVNYYLDAQQDTSIREPATEALRAGWLPCFLSAATTAVGLGSLVVSRLVPIRDFGIFAAIGTMTTCVLTLVLIPGTFTIWRWKPTISQTTTDPDRGEFWLRFAWATIRYRTLILLVTLAVFIGFGAGLPKMRTSVRLDTMFSPTSRVMSDYAWLEEHLGPLVPIEILVRFDAASQLSSRERLSILQNIQQKFREIRTSVNIAKTPTAVSGDQQQWREGISQSALTFLPVFERPQLPVDLPPMQRTMVEQQFQAGIDLAIQQLRPVWEQLGYLTSTDNAETWRVTCFVDSRIDLDYGEYIDHIESHLSPLLLRADGKQQPGMQFTVTGVMPLVHGIQRQLMTDLFQSFLSAFVIITLLMTILQGGLVAGLLSMVSNIFPTVIMFGGMGWSRLPMDIGSVMTASLALGIAVDDTLHFLTFFRRGLELTGNRHKAIEFALKHCGRAMVQTSVVLTIGMSVFGMSDFLPTCRFAWMLVTSLVAALLGDLIILPALLASPLGASFEGGEMDAARDGLSSRAMVHPTADRFERDAA